MKSSIAILISTIFQNGGEATRALETAKIIREHQPPAFDASIVFASHGGPFDALAEREGFEVLPLEPRARHPHFHDEFGTRFGELIGDPVVARAWLESEIKAYEALRPDVVLHGFWPIAGIARRLVRPIIPAIAFLPLPLTEAWLDEVSAFPDELPMARWPKALQRLVLRAMPQALKLKNPALRHRVIARAALDLGWNPSEPLGGIFDMLRADCTLVNDYPFFHAAQRYAERIIFTGPLFAESLSPENDDEAIRRWMSPDNAQKRVFCTLGTSGHKGELLEAIGAFNEGEGKQWSAIVLCPPAVCGLDEARRHATSPHVHVTDRFVNAREINEHADVVVCHGGQGTLQTAIGSGTPLVGLATQPEQQINLEHLVTFGMARRIPIWKWRAAHIRRHVGAVLGDASYGLKARELRRLSSATSTRSLIGDGVWRFLQALPARAPA